MKYLKSKKIDLVVCFGCSIIKDPILNFYKKKFINIHLGLSPYYRGSATNFWPGVNNEPQFFGATFMQLDKGVDTAPILHQFRPLMTINDNIHTIGNKIIMEAISMLPNIIKKFKKIKAVKIDKLKEERVYKKKDYNEKALKSLEKNFKSDMIKKYLKNKKKIDKKYPIIINNCI
jgi:methionyl-tRNA formyltransferase